MTPLARIHRKLRLSWTTILLSTSLSLLAGDPGSGAPPKIVELAATPPSVEASDAGSLITFRLEDPDSSLVTWSITLASAADPHDQPGQLSKVHGTESAGVPVKVLYKAPQTWKALTVVLTVTAMDEKGNSAEPQMLTISVTPGGINRQG
jgi:hypothetical protein